MINIGLLWTILIILRVIKFNTSDNMMFPICSSTSEDINNVNVQFEYCLEVVMLSDKYKKNPIYVEIEQTSKFYNFLSYTTLQFISSGTSSLVNIDTYIFGSIRGTLDSISLLLGNGQISDAYTLLRKYYDLVILNIYVNLYLEDNRSIDKLFVPEINEWLKGKKSLPKSSKMREYLVESEQLKDIHEYINLDYFKELGKRCNDYVHHNKYTYVLINDEGPYIELREKYLDQFRNDFNQLFKLHCSYMFKILPHYMMSSDYIDCLDCGMTPEPGSQYWVASFIQESIDRVFKPDSTDILRFLKNETGMEIEL